MPGKCPFSWLCLTDYSVRQLTILLFTIALLLSISGFVLEYGFAAAPCRMCWWQRYVHYILAGVALLGLIVGRYTLAAVGTILMSLAGFGIAIWQMGGQYKWWQLPEFCMGKNTGATTLTDLSSAFANLPPRCDEVNFTILNFSLAEWNIPAMLLTLLISILIMKKVNAHGR